MNLKLHTRNVVAAAMALGGLSAAAGVSAATIESWTFRGGNCEPAKGMQVCLNAQAWLDGSTLYVNKTYVRAEQPEGGHDPFGGGTQMGGDEGGPGEEGEHDETFNRLPPINMFLTLENSGHQSPDTYTVMETVTNLTSLTWDGFLHRLRRDEAGLAQFLTDPLMSSAFQDAVVSSEEPGGPLNNLIWTGGSLAPMHAAIFKYGLSFADCSGESCSGESVGGLDGFDGYTVNLQQFPLVSSVPEPTPLALLGIGLASFGLIGRLRKVRG